MVRPTLLDQADVIRAVINMRDECEKILAVLLPDGERPTCKHPIDQIEELGDMGDEPSYRCNLCGVEQGTPFSSEA